MAAYDEVIRLARTLPAADQARLVRELINREPAQLTSLGGSAPRPQAPPPAHSVAWLKAERGHAVLATDTGPAEADIPVGFAALAGVWAARSGEPESVGEDSGKS